MPKKVLSYNGRGHVRDPLGFICNVFSLRQNSHMSNGKDYVLGTDQKELGRLRRQHELWKEELLRIWGRAGFRADHRILDLGCGPGFTSRDLARWLGPRGEVTAVDASENFLNYLAAQPSEIEQAPIKVHQAFLEKMDLPAKDFDGAFCRWLMIFVPDCEAALRTVHRHLKKGARFGLQEYIAYDTMALCPDRPSMKPVVDAIFKSWLDQGGDPNRGRILPALLEKTGFRVLEIEPVTKAIRPQDPLWEWPDGFYRNFLPRLVAGGYLTAAQTEAFQRDWDEARRTPGHFLLGPSFVSILAEKV